MLPPPPLEGDPYVNIAPGAPNYGLQGVAYAWDAVRFFFGTAAQAGYADLQVIASMGGELV